MFFFCLPLLVIILWPFRFIFWPLVGVPIPRLRTTSKMPCYGSKYWSEFLLLAWCVMGGGGSPKQNVLSKIHGIPGSAWKDSFFWNKSQMNQWTNKKDRGQRYLKQPKPLCLLCGRLSKLLSWKFLCFFPMKATSLLSNVWIIIDIFIQSDHEMEVFNFLAWGTVHLYTPKASAVLLCLKHCSFLTPALWFTERLNTYNLIMMELSHWQISVRKRGFLGTTRLQIIYKLQFFSNCGLPHISVSLYQLISSGTGIQAQYHRPRIVPLISCNCTSPENTRQLTTKHNWVCISGHKRES